ncbi:hypothetical protein [Caproicibacter sp.]|uniref:hypothetical protein n=1 Tax=Caproicibacter sp. TaxID=2814884 RepID=UPI003989A879
MADSSVEMTNWIMIAITAIYVVATILICIFNYRSAKATREQVAESKRQFEETNRAFVTVTFEIIRSGLAVLHIQNHGKRIAQDVNVTVSSAFLANMADNSDKEHIEKLNNASFTLGIGQSWYIGIGSHLRLKQMSKELLTIDISYADRISHYHESTVIDLKQFFWALLYDSPTENTYQEMKSITKHLNSIDHSMTVLQKCVSAQIAESEKPNV